jgi:hypothetical protein
LNIAKFLIFGWTKNSIQEPRNKLSIKKPSESRETVSLTVARKETRRRRRR